MDAFGGFKAFNWYAILSDIELLPGQLADSGQLAVNIDDRYAIVPEFALLMTLLQVDKSNLELTNSSYLLNIIIWRYSCTHAKTSSQIADLADELPT